MENQNAMENLDSTSTDAGFIDLSNCIMFDQINFPSEFQNEGNREKSMPIPEGPDMNMSPSSVSKRGLSPENQVNQSIGGSGRKRKRNTDQQKPKEVVSVRAKRGQATDSHSLAERLRRERINQKLRRLQDLVPGCYKAMGMAVMLDVIINYVQSLQNQIEFLSMKLTAASMYYDFNASDTDAQQTMQEHEMARDEGYGGTSYYTPTTSDIFECDPEQL